MRIRHNASSAYAWRAIADSSARVDAGVARLSSGNRINSAADDVAGLSISERMRSQFQSLSRATRNALDGLSLVNTADATLQKAQEMLHRGRELAVQASNGVYDAQQRATIQVEVNNLLTEIDRIIDDAQFNGRKIFNSTASGAAVSKTVEGLRSSWLANSEQIIETYYGLTGDLSSLKVVLSPGAGRNGKMTGNVDINGMLKDLTLVLDPEALAALPDPDRVVGRLLTQVVLARNSNYLHLSPWFISGVSDLLVGGDDLLTDVLSTYTAADVVNAMSTPWQDDRLHQASAYVAMKYMQDNYFTPAGTSMADVMTWLKTGANLDFALMFSIGPDEPTFLIDYQLNGTAFLNNMITSGVLSDPNIGGVNPGGASSVIPDSTSYSYNPTENFRIVWEGIQDRSNLQLHVGVNADNYVKVELPYLNRASMDLLGIDMTSKSVQAMEQFSNALNVVTGARSQLGATANTLEHTINANNEAEYAMRSSFSRIKDADYARELLTVTKHQIMVQASTSVLAKANRLREHTAWLLSGLKGGGPTAAPMPST